MNSQNFLVKTCLGTGLFFYSHLIMSNLASAVSLKSYVPKSNLENIVTIDTDLAEELFLIPTNDLSSFLAEIQVANLPLTQEIILQIQSSPNQQPELLKSLLASLAELEFNQNRGAYDEDNIIILSQANDGDIFQDIYDFDTELTGNIQRKPRQLKQNIISKQQNPGLFQQEVLEYTYKSPITQTNNVDSFKNQYVNTATNNQISVPSYTPQNSSLLGNNFYDSQSQYQLPNQFSVSPNNIEVTRFNNIRGSSIQKTPEQIELEKKLEKQREQLEKRNEKLKKRLEKERQKREKQREKEEKKRAKEQEKRLQKIAEQQAKLRNR